jgi:hypothetical protein
VIGHEWSVRSSRSAPPFRFSRQIVSGEGRRLRALPQLSRWTKASVRAHQGVGVDARAHSPNLSFPMTNVCK